MYQMEKVLSNSDIGEDGTIKTLALIDALQNVEGLHIHSLQTLTTYLNEHQAGIFLTYRQVDIHRRPNFNDTIHLVTYPYETRAFYGYRNTIIYDDNQQLVASSYSLGPYVYLKDAKPCKISQAVLDTLLDEKPFDMVYTDRKIEIDESVNKKACAPRHIYPSYIDRYHHLNNAYYIAFAEDILPSESRYHRIRAEYKKSFQVHDIIYPYLYTNDTEWTVVLESKDHQVHAIIQFVK